MGLLVRSTYGCFDEGNQMRRMLHSELMRGQFEQYAAIVLLMGLLLVLAVSVVHGVSLLGA
jgi:hypothetical protein